MTVSNWFEVLDALEVPVELWDTFESETLEAARECVSRAFKVTSWFRVGRNIGQYI